MVEETSTACVKGDKGGSGNVDSVWKSGRLDVCWESDRVREVAVQCGGAGRTLAQSGSKRGAEGRCGSGTNARGEEDASPEDEEEDEEDEDWDMVEGEDVLGESVGRCEEMSVMSWLTNTE